MEDIRVGVLAIQGAVEEHVNSMRKLGCIVKEIREASDISDIDGIILPGGESTAMAIVGESRGIFPILKQWVKDGRPIFGTCAGMILLSDHAIKQREGGQSLIGGLDVEVCRNYFGSQIHSCEVTIPFDSSSIFQKEENRDAFNAIFIRAPAILKVGPDVKILATLNSKPHISALAEVLRVLNLNSSDSSIIPDINAIVAVRQNNILATAFHPELTKDLRWHNAFKNIIVEYNQR